jgi:alpha-tubulin suppressor-like RCC1 family protein
MTPALPLVGTNVSAIGISAGTAHTCAMTSADDVQCWGKNLAGQLGDNTNDSIRAVPKLVAGGQFSATALASGFAHTCAVDANGVAECWGANFNGQIGDGTSTDRLAPVLVLKSTDQSPLAAKAVAAGGSHSCAIDTSGGVWCWGYGQLGNGGPPYEPEAVPVTLAGNVPALGIGAGSWHTCIVHNAVQCWGDNTYGQLGVPGLHSTPAVVALAGGNPVATQVVLGDEHTCALTKMGGVQCWGDNGSGQLGQADELDHLGPTPVSILNGVTVTALASSPDSDATCALTSEGEVWCWGFLSVDFIDGSLSSTPSPLMAADGSTIKAKAVAVGDYHICIITLTGDRQCMGNNFWGQLGNGEHGAWPTVDFGAN